MLKFGLLLALLLLLLPVGFVDGSSLVTFDSSMSIFSSQWLPLIWSLLSLVLVLVVAVAGAELWRNNNNKPIVGRSSIILFGSLCTLYFINLSGYFCMILAGLTNTKKSVNRFMESAFEG